MNTDAATVYRVRPERVAWRAAGDEAVLLDVRQSVYFGLDSSAALLWPYLVAGATAAELAAVLAEHVPVEPGRVAADVRAFLADLEAADLLDRL
ncbi:Coenzyme PQQ synthesis protein D (PqqD) [Micromonospora haikouensis]|uniref:Coenzyme PQQ synthesis protein D (PqqD) n=1 Tax=Micromonospora haikouensis TaxID=686309 RepID=A0A1C4YFS9_9ACTN|nr:PqqD family protein [Micromonospora haikouensis]SCF19585.1 Coenzyme PQQ synthesis protein D (PqqD) [Micromonospora haikouensis]